MIQLFVVVEGPTEEAFVKQVLVPHLRQTEIHATPIIVSTKRLYSGRKFKGGGDWKKWEADIRRLLKSKSWGDLRVTTLFDLYGLPKNFPGLATHGGVPDTSKRCRLLEEAMGNLFDDPRFIPYLQRHEFEALVLAGLSELRGVLSSTEDLTGLDALEKDIGATAPEDINDGEDTHPSKRLEHHIPAYHKVTHGAHATSSLGINELRSRCPRFNEWLKKLESCDTL